MLLKVTLVAALSCAALAVPSDYGTTAGGQGGDSASFGGITGHGASAGGDQGIFKGFAYSHVNVYRPKTQSVPVYYNYYEAAPQQHQETTGQGGGLDVYKTHSALQGFGQKAHSGFTGGDGIGFVGAEAHDGAVGDTGEYMKEVGHGAGIMQAAEGSFDGAQNSAGHAGQYPEFQEFQAKVGGYHSSGQVVSGDHEQYRQGAEQQTGGHFGLFYPTVTHDQQLHY